MVNEEQIRLSLSRIKMRLFNIDFTINLEQDKIYVVDGRGRNYLQVSYIAPCNKTGKIQEWKGGKHYLSDYMTIDEVIKKAWVAFESAIKHETMECFLIDGKPLFNPHTDFESLLSISENEVKR